MNRVVCVAVAVAALGLLGVAHAVFAQSNQVRIVQAGDGTLYLLKNGARYTIAVDAIDDDELAAYPDAGTLGFSQLLAAISTGSDPAALAQPAQTGDDQAQPGDTGAATDTGAQPSPPPAAADQQPAAPPTQAQPCQPQPAGAKGSASCPSAGRPASVAATPNFVAARTVATGGTASVSVTSAPGTTCSLQYRPPNATAFSTIGQQTADANGLLTWSVPVGDRAGVSTLIATCGELSTTNTMQIGTAGTGR